MRETKKDTYTLCIESCGIS